MPDANYLIVGSSHAALEAADAIRRQDPEGSVVMLTRDGRLPYSPTILPYVVSGRSQPERVVLRGEAWFDANRIRLVRNAAVTAVDADSRTVTTTDGAWSYGKLLLATGARPLLPPVPGLKDVPHHVLRSMDDAVGLRQAIGGARSAVVLGAGLVGMHAAENLLKAGLAVTVVEMQPRVLAGYFDAEASGRIAEAFTAKGAALKLGQAAVSVERAGQGARVALTDGSAITADLLLVAAGVAPELGYLAGSSVATERGVLVDARMRSSADAIWAAGDVAQGPDFYSAGRVLNGILPSAMEQGRVAGMDMAGDPAAKLFPGAVPLNTYAFFGSHAVSVGQAAAEGDGIEVHRTTDGGYLHIALKDDRLWGVAAIDVPLDPGILWQLILRRVDLGPVKAAFLAQPRETARTIMSRLWR